jgi:predicted MPP superfamily phosphohydrolase
VKHFTVTPSPQAHQIKLRLNAAHAPCYTKIVYPLFTAFTDERPLLVVPDLHQDLSFLNRVVAVAQKEGASLTFLGDYVDAVEARWADESGLRAIISALLELSHHHSAGCVFLAGNHDVAMVQATRHRAALLHAGDHEQVAKLDHALPHTARHAAGLALWTDDFLRTWRIATLAHGFLLSHAGVARCH